MAALSSHEQSLEPQEEGSGRPPKLREQLAETPNRQRPVGPIQKLLFGNRIYLSFPRSGKGRKGDIGGKRGGDALGLLLPVVVDPVVVEVRRVAMFKWNGWRGRDGDLRRRGLTPVK